MHIRHSDYRVRVYLMEKIVQSKRKVTFYETLRLN